MKHLLLLTSTIILCASSLRAQFTIPTVESSRMRADSLVGPIRTGNVDGNYYSEALIRAQKRAMSKERNAIEFNLNVAATQTQFINWQAGGDNTFSSRSSILFHHVYKRSKFSIDYRIDARFGMNLIEDKLFKNEDEFKINFMSSWTMRKNWSYAASVNLRSQFAAGRKSRTDATKISDFMAPGFFDMSVGLNYKRENSPWNITLSPIGGSVVMILDEELSERGISGVAPGHRTKGQMGPSVRIFYDKEFSKKVFRYRFNIYSFTNLKTPPTLRWENALEIRATKYLSTTIYGLVYYDKYSGTAKPQYNYSLSVGLSYKIKNK